jgi:hypothetical protein
MVSRGPVRPRHVTAAVIGLLGVACYAMALAIAKARGRSSYSGQRGLVSSIRQAGPFM